MGYKEFFETYAPRLPIKRIIEKVNDLGVLTATDIEFIRDETASKQNAYIDLLSARKTAPFGPEYDAWRSKLIAAYLEVFNSRYPELA